MVAIRKPSEIRVFLGSVNFPFEAWTEQAKMLALADGLWAEE